MIGSLLEELWKGGEEKIVVVSNFTSTLDIIHAHCTSKKYPICRLDGYVNVFLSSGTLADQSKLL